jgi:hypothetical protein
MEENKEQMTLGEQRCHINFNPSSNDKIENFKKIMAYAIDFCNDESEHSEYEAGRCFSIAMEHLETAQMYAVKAMSKNLKKD